MGGAWKPLIVCDPGVVGHDCDFTSLMQLLHNLVTDLVLLSTLLAVAVFCWAGIILLTSGGNPSKWEKAKNMLWKVVLGYVWILAAWLIVYTITSALLNPGYSVLMK